MSYLDLPGYRDYILHDFHGFPTFAVFSFLTCRIHPASTEGFLDPPSDYVTEIILPDTCDYDELLLRLEIPYYDLPDTILPCSFPWQSAGILNISCNLISTKHIPDLEYHPEFSLIPVRLIPSSQSIPRLRCVDESLATHFLVRTIWRIPTHARATNSYDYEAIFDRASFDYTASVRAARNLPLYRHAVSHSCPYGVDYWVLPS